MTVPSNVSSTMPLLLQVDHPLSEMFGTRRVSDFDFFSDFGILAYCNEIAWVWEPNLNAKSIYVSHTACEYVGFI
jgi:hypothetical protein